MSDFTYNFQGRFAMVVNWHISTEHDENVPIYPGREFGPVTEVLPHCSESNDSFSETLSIPDSSISLSPH